MVADPRRRQKKLAQKVAKRKAKKEKSAARITDLLASFSNAFPVHECYVGDKLFKVGMGQVLISRKQPDGCFATSVFLLDIYCLGVKNALFTVLSGYQFDKIKSELEEREGLTFIHQACARKLVEEAVEYAKDLGFSPHKDYSKAKQIFGGIDSTVCPKSFVFGKEGKPLYIPGPKDTPAMHKRVIATLTRCLGPDGFHFITGFSNDNIGDFLDE